MSFEFPSMERRARPAVQWEALLKNAELTPEVRSHLSRVYSTLAIALLAASVGVVAHLAWNLGGLLSTLAGFGLMMYLGTDTRKEETTRRVGVLAALGFCNGLSIGPLVALAIDVDPALLVLALLGSTLVFVCFSASAMLASRQQRVALGGLLSFALSFLMVLSFAQFFVRSPLVFSLYLYLGLAVFCGYVVYDTQVILERVRLGDRDYVWHAVELFIDFVGIFVRLLVILLKNQANREEKKGTRRR